MITGPDVSHWQGHIDWRAVAQAGHTFAWCKATEGTTFVDSKFRTNWEQIDNHGLIRGAYHFLRHGNAAAQVRHFIKTTGNLMGSMAAVDVESSGDSFPNLQDVNDFAAEFARLTNDHPLVVYTGGWYWTGHMGNPNGTHVGPLWHSRYSAQPGSFYGGWRAFTFWQYTNQANVPGISGGCDMNIFAGNNSNDLLALTQSNGENMPTKEEFQTWMIEVLAPGAAEGTTGWPQHSRLSLERINWLVNNVNEVKAMLAALGVTQVNIQDLILAGRIDIPSFARELAQHIPIPEVTQDIVEAGIRDVFGQLDETPSVQTAPSVQTQLAENMRDLGIE